MIKTAKAITDGEIVVAVDGRLIRGRTADAGCKIKHGCHVFHVDRHDRLSRGRRHESAPAMAAHESPGSAVDLRRKVSA
jgi:hypothetical protein